MIRSITGIVLSLFCLAALPLNSQGEPSFPPGRIHETVSCIQHPDEAYALYLPRAFNADRKWPVIVALDPGGVVLVPMKLLHPMAEEFGCILICPCKVKNGPLQPAFQAMDATWRDLSSRFPLDLRRIYVVGFSGGARMASLFPLVTGQIPAGIMACGAGLGYGLKPEQLAQPLYFGFAGYADFNYWEMVDLQKTFSDRSRPSRFVFTDHPHNWPAESVCRRALTWFTIMAMKEGLIEKSDQTIEEYHRQEMEIITARAEQGETYFAARELSDLAETCDGLMEQSEVENMKGTVSRWKESKGYSQFRKEEEGRLNRETATLKRTAKVFQTLIQGPPDDTNINGLIAGIGLGDINKTAAQARNPYERGLARRLKSAIADAANEKLLTYLEQKKEQTAEYFSQVLCKACEGTRSYPAALYNNACVQARLGRKKQALRSLKKAVEEGFSDLTLLNEDPDMNPLRQMEEFQKIQIILQNQSVQEK